MANLSSDILWSGKVSFRKGMFLKKFFCVITPDKFVLYKGNNSKGKVFLEVLKSNIVNISLPKLEIMDYLIKGAQGFIVKHEVEGVAQKDIRFWAAGFGQYPDKKEMLKMGEALSVIYSTNKEELTSKDNNMSAAFPITLAGVIAIFTCGLLPAVIIIIATAQAVKIYNNEEMDKTVRTILAVLLVLASFGIGLALNVGALFLQDY